jgi:hypothetical protein
LLKVIHHAVTQRWLSEGYSVFIDARGKLAKQLGLVEAGKKAKSPQVIPKAKGLKKSKVESPKKVAMPDLSGYVVLFTGFRDATLRKQIEARGGESRTTMPRM